MKAFVVLCMVLAVVSCVVVGDSNKKRRRGPLSKLYGDESSSESEEYESRPVSPKKRYQRKTPSFSGGPSYGTVSFSHGLQKGYSNLRGGYGKSSGSFDEEHEESFQSSSVSKGFGHDSGDDGHEEEGSSLSGGYGKSSGGFGGGFGKSSGGGGGHKESSGSFGGGHELSFGGFGGGHGKGSGSSGGGHGQSFGGFDEGHKQSSGGGFKRVLTPMKTMG
nr:glycine-rich cell wall structural protein 2-like [Aedes albopictus]